MKIIITESQLNDFYDQYITYDVGNLEMLTNMVKKHRFGYDTYPDSIFWRNDENEIIFERDGRGRFWVSANLWERIMGFLNIKENKDINNVFEQWIKKHLNIESPKVFKGHFKDWDRWKNLIKDPRIV